MAEGPDTGDDGSISLAEHVCLALVVEEPRHGWSIVRELDRRGPLGGIWSLSRALTYRALDQLERKGLIARGPSERGRGPTRVTFEATERGRVVAGEWLFAPVRHVRDLRTEFLLKATLLQRSGGDLLGLLDAQQAELDPVLQILGDDTNDSSPVGLWRSESAYAAQRFFERLRAELTTDRDGPNRTE